MSSDGFRHEGEMEAPDKDSVYTELRKRGIRAIRVNERIVPIVKRGLKGLRKHDVVYIVLVVLFLIVLTWVVSAFRTERVVRRESVGQDVLEVEKVTSDPVLQKEMRRVMEERKALEDEFRERFVQRVKDGALSREEANEMFRAMGVREIE